MWNKVFLINFIKNYLPPRAEVLLLKKPYKRLAICIDDLDGDGLIEIKAAYKWRGEKYIIILKNYFGFWYIMDNIKCKTFVESKIKPTLVNTRSENIDLYLATVKTKKGTKSGYIDKKGDFIIKPQYDYALDFQDNDLAVVQMENLYGIINKKGEYIVKPEFEFITQFSEGLAQVVDRQGFKVIDEEGKIITSKAYDYIGAYNNSRAVFTISDKDEKYFYGYLDKQGNEIISPQYLSASDFKEGKAIVRLKDEEYALIGPYGQILNTYKYPFVGNLSEGLLIFKKNVKGKYGYINEQGKVIIPPRYTMAYPFKEGRAEVNVSDKNRNKYGIIDKKGDFVIKPKYNDINLLGEDRVAVGEAIYKSKPFVGSKYAIFDTNGNTLTDFIYYAVSNYEDGLASAYDDKNTFFIDKTGNIEKTLPIVRGNGTLKLEEDIIKSNVDFRISYLDKMGNIIWKQNTKIPLNNKYSVIEEKFNPNKDYLVYYPIVEGMENEIVEKDVNNKLKKLSKVKYIPANIQLDYDYFGDFNVEFYKKNLLVLQLDGYEYYYGAAHGMPTEIYPHINLVTGNIYELKDLFKKNSKYIQVINEFINYEIKNNPKYSYVFPDSFKGIKENQPFYVDESNLYIYFYPYEIAPYVAGFPTFKIPYKDIMNIIDVNGEFWRSFNM